jgi:ribosomal-protein-alanine N-acetyltransferase
MRRRHLRQILAIESQVYPRPWTRGVFQSELDQAAAGRRHYVVARRGRRVVGYGGVMFTDERLSDGEAHVTNVAVDPTAWRSGVGRTLMLALVREARRRGCTSMSLEVRVTNEAAQALYRQFGFVPAGIRQRYYENTDDAIVMWCHDIDGDEYAERLARLEQGA